MTILIGGGALLAAWLVHVGHRLALSVSAACGVGIVVYQLAGIMVVPFTWVQPLYIVIGALILAMTGLLRTSRTALA